LGQRSRAYIRWRENWAKINNRKFEEKGLDVRIDHRTLRAQGIDREPTVHMGHEAWALERQGIRTESGDRNREIKQRNEERAKKSEHGKESTETASNENSVIEPTAEKTAEYLNKLREDYIAHEKNLSELIARRNEIREDIPRLNFRTESRTNTPKTLKCYKAELQNYRKPAKT